MRKITRTAVALAFVVLMVGAAAAAPTVDSETTTTTTTSDLTDGTEVPSFNASSDQIPTLQASYATTKPEIQVIDPDSGAVIETFTNESDPGYFTQTGGSGPYYYNTTFNESDFAAMPMDAGENKSVTLRLIDNSSLDDPSSSDMTNVTVYLNNTDERAVVNAEASEADAISATFDEAATIFGLSNSVPGISAYDQYSVEGSSVGVADNTEVYVVYGTSDAADAFTTALNDRGVRSISESDWNKFVQLDVDDSPYKVFQTSAPEDVDDGMTYGVTTTVGPTDDDAVAVTLGDSFDDSSSVDVNSRANDMEGLGDQLELATRGLPLLGLLVAFGYVGRRRTRQNTDQEE